VVALEMPPTPGKADTLMALLVAAIKTVATEVSLAQINAEGGATAAALVRALGWNRLRVVGELSPGVVTTSPAQNAAVDLTIKPGSYQWPTALRP